MDMAISLPDSHLDRISRLELLEGLEIRLPILDNNLVEYVMGLPSSHKMVVERRVISLREHPRCID